MSHAWEPPTQQRTINDVAFVLALFAVLTWFEWRMR